MARKKRKAVKSPPLVSRFAPPGETGGFSAWALPALGALALILSWLAMLGGAAESPAEFNLVFNYDTARPWLMFRDMFVVDAFPADGWRTGNTQSYIPDMALLWAIFAAGAGPVTGMWLYALAQPVLAAAGWILVCDRLFGKSPARRTAVLLAHALCLLFLAWNPPGVFLLWAMPVHHSGTWALVPWALWLLLIALDAPPTHKIKLLSILFSLLCLAIASDLLFLPWMVAPALAVLLCLLALGRMRAGEFGVFAVVLIASVPLGRVLHSATGLEAHRNVGDIIWNVNADGLAAIPTGFAGWFANLAGNYPLEALVFALFAFLAAWRAIGALRPSWAPVRIFAEPKGRGALFMALFAPASMAATVCAVHVNSGGILDENHPGFNELFYSHYHRYVFPLVWFPLFVGWALFPWRAKLFRVRPVALALGASLVVFAASAPKSLAVRFSALDPFNTPFHRCFEGAAARLNWSGGVASFPVMSMLANERAHLERILPVGAARRGPGRSRLYVDWVGINRHYFSGEFQFVYVPAFKGRLFRAPPRDENDQGEPMSDNPLDFHLFLDDAAVRGAFGDPAEIVECAGVGLYHYDPPLRLDFSAVANPDFAQVGRTF